jgi:hypothetical protein
VEREKKENKKNFERKDQPMQSRNTHSFKRKKDERARDLLIGKSAIHRIFAVKIILHAGATLRAQAGPADSLKTEVYRGGADP